MILRVLAAGLAIAAAFFGALAALGLLRLPDVYTRTHAAGKAETLTAFLGLSAAAVALGFDVALLKLLFLLVFLFMTSPTAAHAIARAAMDQGIVPWTPPEDEEDASEHPAEEGDAS